MGHQNELQEVPDGTFGTNTVLEPTFSSNLDDFCSQKADLLPEFSGEVSFRRNSHNLKLFVRKLLENDFELAPKTIQALTEVLKKPYLTKKNNF